VPYLTRIQPTPEQIRDGVEHQFMVTRDGTLMPVHALRRAADGKWWGSGQPRPDGSVRWPAMNYFHPENQERFIELVGELGDRYGDYPAWKGVALVVGRCMGPMEPALLRSRKLLQAGYEDFTIDLFEEETGIEVPVDKKDPERFEKRYQWITVNARDRWLLWRCRKYTELYRRMRDRLLEGHNRDDLNLHLIVTEPMLWLGSQEILDGHYDDLPHLLDVLRQFGFDLPTLKQEKGIVVSANYAQAGTGEARATGGHDGWRELTLNDAWQSVLADDNKAGAYVKSGLEHFGLYIYPEGRWIFSRSRSRQGYFFSTHLSESYVNVMARSNPTFIPHTWMDISASIGRLHEHRVFARAYRSLPNGKYERLAGNGLDRNIWISKTSKDGADYAYAANLDWWRPSVTLRFTEGAKVQDLIRDVPVVLENGGWTYQMEPYSIQSFRVTDGRLISAETAIPESDRAYLESHVRSVLKEAEEVLAKARARDAELRDKRGWHAIGDLESRIEQLETSIEEGDLAGAYRLTLGALPIAQETISRILRGGEIVPIWM